MSYKKGDWFVYCDICGQRSYASKTTKLSQYTGRGGLVVCRHDADTIDRGLIPFSANREVNVPYIRTNHTNTEDASPLIDPETQTYIYYLAASQDNVILTTSQDDEWLEIGVAI